MFKNYLHTALRNIRKYRIYSFINISGLAVGLTCILFILLTIRFERSYDDYHSASDSIFRIAVEFRTRSTTSLDAMTYSPVRKTLKEHYPDVMYAARIRPQRNSLVRSGKNVFYEDHRLYTDTDLFGILSISFIAGDPTTALDRPHTVVITRALAQKYFGTTDIVGQRLEIDGTDHEVTGVVHDCPRNTHLKYALMQSFENFQGERWVESWTASMAYNYIRLYPTAEPSSFEAKIARISDPYTGERDAALGYSKTYFLQHIPSIHLHSHLEEELEPPGSPLYLLVYSIVGFLILLIASLNFINLTTALSAQRAKEVGIRKAVGARRNQLVTQFLGDGLVFAFLAMGLSLLIAWTLLPFFNQLSGMSFTLKDLINPMFLLILGGLTTTIALTAGSYPAFFLSRFHPVSTLRGNLRFGTRGGLLRKVLVVAQFSISVILIICTMMMVRQLDYMKNEHLGFFPAQKLIIPFRGGIEIDKTYETLKHEFTAHPAIAGAAVSSHVPGRLGDTQYIYRFNALDDRRQVMNHLYIDTDFLSLYEIEMAAGRPLDLNLRTDIDEGIILNRSAAQALGYLDGDAVGKQVESGPDGNRRTIVGVTEDFHYYGLTSEIEPLVMKIVPSRFQYLTLSLGTNNLQESLAFIDEKLHALYPNHPFNPFFLDEFFNRQYRKEEQVGKLFGTLSTLGLIIACMGLFGLASFLAERKTKEIGIRRILGASQTGVVVLLSNEFIKWVGLANLLAWPVAYLVIHRWLQEFPYRTSVAWWMFILSGFLSLFVALATVSYRTIRAALANPTESLRYE